MKQFIKDNDISFEKGSRNQTVTTLIGYSLFRGFNKSTLKKNLSIQIKADSFIEEEIDRLWNYCDSNNYGNFWGTTTARNEYKF